jgi:hypothetical protein
MESSLNFQTIICYVKLILFENLELSSNFLNCQHIIYDQKKILKFLIQTTLFIILFTSHMYLKKYPKQNGWRYFVFGFLTMMFWWMLPEIPDNDILLFNPNGDIQYLTTKEFREKFASDSPFGKVMNFFASLFNFLFVYSVQFSLKSQIKMLVVFLLKLIWMGHFFSFISVFTMNKHEYYYWVTVCINLLQIILDFLGNSWRFELSTMLIILVIISYSMSSTYTNTEIKANKQTLRAGIPVLLEICFVDFQYYKFPIFMKYAVNSIMIVPLYYFSLTYFEFYMFTKEILTVKIQTIVMGVFWRSSSSPTLLFFVL